MNDQQVPRGQTKIVEITAGSGKAWYADKIGQRFMVKVDMAGSRGLARWKVVEDPQLIYGVEERISYLCSRYVTEGDCKIVED